ncbi:hypothetical protein V2V90_23240 (plasmid) [Agrobacterium leguminum]|uniref:hypothetical protein n=1 Tax=Agrobacterium leguminum TaxID=2792015 RepID=UPI0030D3E394
MDEEKPSKVAFLPETRGSERVWKAIDRARQLASEKGFESLTIGLELSLKRRSEILDGFGKEFFDGHGWLGPEDAVAGIFGSI